MNFKKCSIMFIYYFIFVTISFFFSPFLTQNKGFSTQAIADLTIIGYALLLIVFLLFGYIADKINSSKKIIIANLFITSILFIILILFENTYILSLSYILTYPFFMALTSLLDGFVLNNIDENEYPYIRSIGSLGAAISYFLNSIFIGNFNYYNIMIFQTILVMLLLFFVCISLEVKQVKSNVISYKEGLKELKVNKEVLLILIITFFTYGTLSADDAYTYAYNIELVHISNFIFGLTGLLSISLEFIIMIFYNFLYNMLSISKILYISSITLLFIYLTKYLCTDYPLIITIGNVLLGIFTGFFIPSIIFLITKYSNLAIRNTMLGLYQISIKSGALIIATITAYFYSKTNYLPNIYLLHAILIAGAIFTIFILGKLMKKGTS